MALWRSGDAWALAANPGTSNHGKPPPREVVRGTMGGQRSRRADRAPGRCRAGEGVAWRRCLTGRFASSAYFAALRARLGRTLLAVHFLPELGRGFAVDRLQGCQRAQDLGVPLGLEIAVDLLEQRHLTQW